MSSKWLSKRWWLCEVLKWHWPTPASMGTLGVNPQAVCKRCGRDIMRDSQGNWF